MGSSHLGDTHLSTQFGVRNFRLNNGWVSEPVKNTSDSIQQHTMLHPQ